MEAGSRETTSANLDVLAFYRELPFNYRQSTRSHARQIRETNQLEGYPPLVPLLKAGTSILDVGCGAGWFALTACHHYGCHVTGIDFNDVAIARARDIAGHLKGFARFQVADLFRFESSTPYDIVAAIGVLHHTNDCHAGLRQLCTKYVRPGGHVLIGLYHRYGRRPFLEHFRQMNASGASNTDMLARYRQLHSSLTDETHALSWFRDQVLHPHETQHTLEELLPVLEACQMTLVSTSINGFARFDDIAELTRAESDLEKIGIERLRQNRYYPGFFVFLASKL